MISENILLFPTLITVGKREVDELEKESWFSAYLDMSDGKGNSNEYTGHKSVHHDIRFTKVFSDIADTIRNHLTTLGVDTSMIEVNITKSFFSNEKSDLGIKTLFFLTIAPTLIFSGKFASLIFLFNKSDFSKISASINSYSPSNKE